MSKTVGTFHQECRFLGIKIWDVSNNYIQLSTEEDTEEIRDDIFMHELMIKNKGKII